MKPSPPSPLSKPFCRARLALAAALGFAAVVLGALGAHALAGRLDLRGTRGVWETAVLYHFVHVIVLLFLALVAEVPGAVVVLFVAGIVCFSGSLYVLALASVPWLGSVTPLGGLFLLAGWAGLFLRGVRR